MNKKLTLLAVLLSLLFAAVGVCAQLNACDINSDDAVDMLDVVAVENMALGATACTAQVNGPNVCNVQTVQRVITAALGGGCNVTNTNTHSATLHWVASISDNVVNYNVYRGTVSGVGPYTILAAGVGNVTTYTDTAVQAGQTYYYVVTAVDSGGAESEFSNFASGTIPYP